MKGAKEWETDISTSTCRFHIARARLCRPEQCRCNARRRARTCIRRRLTLPCERWASSAQQQLWLPRVRRSSLRQRSHSHSNQRFQFSRHHGSHSFSDDAQDHQCTARMHKVWWKRQTCRRERQVREAAALRVHEEYLSHEYETATPRV